MQFINPNYPWKNGIKQTKINKEKMLESCISYPIERRPKDADPNNNVKK